VARYERGTEEFGRVATFSDGVFAIAMTLLVVGIAVPTVEESELNTALSDLFPDIIAFFISFLVIGRYWVAHHRFFARLGAVDSGLMTVNLMYLAAIAFVPFPTGLVSRYENSAITIVIYASALGAASLLEGGMLVMARRAHAFREPPGDDVFRFEVIASVIPVTLFVISVPIAFVSTTLALWSWILVFPAERIIARLAPARFRATE
jgi:uncharacterized membrane protein